MLRIAGALAILLAFEAGTPTQSDTSFEGRWRLTDRGLTTLPLVDDLIVRGPLSKGTFSVEQRAPDGVSWVRFTIARHVSAGGRALPFNRAFPNLATWRQHDSRLALETGTAVRTRPGPAAAHEEVWAMAGSDVLTVDIITRSFGGVPRTVRLHYRRVPRPDLTPGQNLVENARAEAGATSWWQSGEAVVEPCDGNPCFAVRNGGTFQQTILLPPGISGRYLVIIGSGLSERVNADGGITGLPTLYATVHASDGVRIVSHLQGMLARPTRTNDWVTMSGVFRMPDDADALSLQLNQASARGLPHDGSAARFDDVGVYVFATEQDARAFAGRWRGR